MITVTITMDAVPSKRQELLQTLYELSEGEHKQKGFLDSHICMDARHENALTLIEEWETQEDVMTYLQSEYFRVLLGAMKLLTSCSEISFSPAARVTGKKLIHTVSIAELAAFSEHSSLFPACLGDDEQKQRGEGKKEVMSGEQR